MSRIVFYDEIRTWRYPATYLAMLGSLTLSTIGFWLLYHAVIDDKTTMAFRLFVGSVFGAGFGFGFGTVFIIMFFRLLKSPTRIIMDSNGIIFGDNVFPWPDISVISIRNWEGSVWLYFKTASPESRWFLVPGPSLPSQTYVPLIKKLKRHFSREELNIEIEFRRFSGITTRS